MVGRRGGLRYRQPFIYLVKQVLHEKIEGRRGCLQKKLTFCAAERNRTVRIETEGCLCRRKVKGARGAARARGVKGAKGARGATRATRASGARGAARARGARGARGPSCGHISPPSKYTSDLPSTQFAGFLTSEYQTSHYPY